MSHIIPKITVCLRLECYMRIIKSVMKEFYIYLNTIFTKKNKKTVEYFRGFKYCNLLMFFKSFTLFWEKKGEDPSIPGAFEIFFLRWMNSFDISNMLQKLFAPKNGVVWGGSLIFYIKSQIIN